MKKTLFFVFVICVSSVFCNNDHIVKRDCKTKPKTIVQCPAELNCPTSPQCECYIDYFSGPYLGLGVGLQHIATKLNNDSFYHLINNNIDPSQLILAGEVIQDTHFGDYFLIGQISAGYGCEFNNCVYLGGEVFFKNNVGNEFHKCKFSSDEKFVNFLMSDPLFERFFNSKLTFERYYEIGGIVKIGFLPVSKTMVYLTFGVQCSEFKVITTNEFHFEFIGFDDKSKFNFKEWQVAGILPGFGIETMISDHFSLRGEYSYSFYGAIKKTKIIESTLPLSQIIVNKIVQHKFKADELNEGTFVLSLCYHFNGR